MPVAPQSKKRAFGASLMAAAALSFSPSASAAQARTPALTEGETWWYSQRLNSVLSFRPCPERGLCARVVWYEHHDRRLSDLFNPAQRNSSPVNMCNYNFRASFQAETDNRWNGQLQVPNRGWNVSVRLDGVDANTLRMHARQGIVWSTENLRRVPVGDTRYTVCRPSL